MKRLTCLLLLLFLLTGCAKTQPETTTAPSTEPVPSVATTAPTTVPTAVPTTEPVTEPVTEPTEPELEIPAGATELSAEEIDFFADLLEQKASSEGFPGNNWYNLALGCEFETPAEIDFYQLFRQRRFRQIRVRIGLLTDGPLHQLGHGQQFRQHCRNGGCVPDLFRVQHGGHGKAGPGRVPVLPRHGPVLSYFQRK